MCIDSAIQKLFHAMRKKTIYIHKSFGKAREKRIYSERHLPSLFVMDLIRTLSDAKLMFHY
jgi:hypothetical protein